MITRSEQHAAMSYLIDEHADHLRSAGCSEDTIYRRRNLLKRLNEHLPLGLAYATTTQLEAFLARLHKLARSRATLCTYSMHIRGFYAWADSTGILDGDPTLLMHRPRPPRFQPKPAAIEEVRVALTSPEPWHTMYSLAYFEAMRACEVAACRREDITEDITYIPRGKGGRKDSLPTHEHVWELVRDRPPGRLFPSGNRGGVVNGHWVTQNAKRQFVALGLRKMSIHRLRHSFATHLIQAGVDAVTVQKLMRHSSLATTQVYVETTSERKRAAIALLPVPGFGTPAGWKPAGVARGRPEA